LLADMIVSLSRLYAVIYFIFVQLGMVINIAFSLSLMCYITAVEVLFLLDNC